VDAIGHANRVIDWLENIPSEDMPPEWMWPFTEELNDHFDEVKAKRGSKTEDDDSSMMRNEDPRLRNIRGR
jgi:hypothetical protein